MNQIGEGFQCRVYDIGKNRVLKKNHSLSRGVFTIYMKTRKNRSFGFFQSFRDYWRVQSFFEKSKNILVEREVLPKYIGSPVFQRGGSFTQERVEPVLDFLNRSSITEQKKLLKKCIYLTRVLISTYGIADKSFNIPNNYGVTNRGRVILLDFGELLQNAKEVAEKIKTKPWEKEYVAGSIQSAEVKKFFLASMDKNMYSYSTPRVRAFCVHKENLLVIYREKKGEKYYTLPGGGIDRGESPEQAVLRELREETGAMGSNPKFLKQVRAGSYLQFSDVYKVLYVSGEPHLPEDSEEFEKVKIKEEIFRPMWVSTAKLKELPLRPAVISENIKQLLADFVAK